jgi:undecaprenyl-diphosphatase
MGKRIFLVGFTALFALLLWFVLTGRTQTFDERILNAFFDLRGDVLTKIFRAITFCGNSTTVIGFCVLAIILPCRMKVGLPAVLMTAAGAGVQAILKMLVARPRPDMANWLVEETTYSFPSGHASVSMIFWVALLILAGRMLLRRKGRRAALFLRVPLAVFATLIGLSRNYLGVHYPSDVLGGWLLAGILLIILFAAYDRFWPSKWRAPGISSGSPLRFRS